MIANKKWIRLNVYDKFKLHEIRDENHQPVIDPMVYNDGTLRTYLSCKEKKPYRPFKFDELSEHSSELESFIGYSSEHGFDATVGRVEVEGNIAQSNTTLPSEIDQVLREFVVEKFGVQRDGIYLTTTFGNNEPKPYRVDFKDKPCKIAKREHKNNTQYIVVGPLHARYLCHDVADCGQKDGEKLEVKFEDYTEGVKKVMTSPCQEVLGEFIETVKSFTGDVIGTSEFDMNTHIMSAPERETSKYFNVDSPGRHIACLNGYRLEKADMTIEFKKALEASPKVLNFLTVNQHYYGAQDEEVHNVKIPADLFNNPRITEMWEELSTSHRKTS